MMILRVLGVGLSGIAVSTWLGSALAHPVPGDNHHPSDHPGPQAPDTETPADGLSGQGPLRFRVFADRSLLPDLARDVLDSVHGGFGVDRRVGHGETYFALAGAGILRIAADLRQVEILDTPPPIRTASLHNTTVWHDETRGSHLVFPANAAGRIFTTTLDGAWVSELPAPNPSHQFDQVEVNAYFAGGGAFVPTDVAYLHGRYFITTGYSPLDYVLTARVEDRPSQVAWSTLAFGGKGTSPGTFGTGHGITVVPHGTTLAVADRAHAKIDYFSRDGQFLRTLELPEGSFPCDIDYAAGFAVVGCLHGPDRSQGAPIYVLKEGKVVSTILPKQDLGLERFQHVHNAVMRSLNGRLYILAQAWNPGDFVILEQVPLSPDR